MAMQESERVGGDIRKMEEKARKEEEEREGREANEKRGNKKTQTGREKTGKEYRARERGNGSQAEKEGKELAKTILFH